MKTSLFNVTQPYNDGILLYNTFTTSLVELEEPLYNDIFLLQHFDEHAEEVALLHEMGFIVLDDCDELQEQQLYRQTVIDNNSGNIANIIIAPTMACNARCFYCFEKGHREGKMSLETADAVIAYLEEHWNGKKLGITWFGGEPLMAVDIIEHIVSGLKEKGIVFESKITTNGSLLTPDVVRIIKKNWCVDKIQITIDAVGEEYNRIKNYIDIDNAFEKVMANIEFALSEQLPVKIRINFDPTHEEIALYTMQYLGNRFYNYDQLSIYFAPIDEDEAIVTHITNTFAEKAEHPYISLIKFGRKHGYYRGFPDMEDNDEHDAFDERGLLKKLKIAPSPTNCYATCPSVYSIDCNGGIYKCHRALGRKEFQSGDVVNGILENNIYRFFCNTDLMYEECKNCAILPICQGGCKMNTKLYCGKTACAPAKAIIKELILLYKEDLDNISHIK